MSVKGFEALERLTALKEKVDEVTHETNQDLTYGIQKLMNGYRYGETVEENLTNEFKNSLTQATKENYENSTWEEMNAALIKFGADIEQIIDTSGVIEYDDTFKD